MLVVKFNQLTPYGVIHVPVNIPMSSVQISQSSDIDPHSEIHPDISKPTTVIKITYLA